MELIIGIKTVAERRGDDLVINGAKMWTTNAFQADWMCCLANTSKEGPVHQNKSLICVPMDTKGEQVLHLVTWSSQEIHFSFMSEIKFGKVVQYNFLISKPNTQQMFKFPFWLKNILTYAQFVSTQVSRWRKRSTSLECGVLTRHSFSSKTCKFQLRTSLGTKDLDLCIKWCSFKKKGFGQQQQVSREKIVYTYKSLLVLQILVYYFDFTLTSEYMFINFWCVMMYFLATYPHCFYEIIHAMSNVCFVNVDLIPLQNIIAATIEYTSQRQAFGRPVLNNQVVHFRYLGKKTQILHLHLYERRHHTRLTELNWITIFFKKKRMTIVLLTISCVVCLDWQS